MHHPKMTPHLHLCLQSGSERILLAMRRQYNLAEFKNIVGKIRERRPDFNITTDLIVGFPGETEDEFAGSVAACEELGFGHIHTFPYSRRDGTRADRMDGQVPENVKKDRGEVIRLMSERTKRAYRETFPGRTQEVLVERAGRRADGLIEARGLGEHYVPVRFILPGARDPREVENQFFTVRVTGVDAGEDPDLTGEVEVSLD